eukprot:TRINITY_DN32822_c0_g1_i1.p1 TRINITY_DN32822_c0_g1~~TRINITY_DN32822_c0_g1_i1.p1  ORF type:complete len:385 (+),score=84.20 TRINITY_DN32822_c0_g1_i1:132-1286(+)
MCIRDSDEDPLERNGSVVLVAMLTLSSTYLLLAPKVVVILLWLFILIGILIRIYDRANWRIEERTISRQTQLLRFLYVVLLAVTPALFHGATGAAVIASGRAVIEPPLLGTNEAAAAPGVDVSHTAFLPSSPTLWDGVFLKMDTLFLGWAFPHGQVGLWAQASPVFNPAAPLGKLVTEVLQCTYMSYYFWGNGMLLFMCLVAIAPSCANRRWAWRRTRMLLYGWIAAYCLNFAINFTTPAVSPRLWLQHYYHTPLKGLFLGELFQGAIKSAAGSDAYDPKSFGAFPSGHVGLTWLAAFAAGALGYATYARVARVGACLMTMAVVYLRYHYFVDALFATVLVGTGLVVGRMTPGLMQRDAMLKELNSEEAMNGHEVQSLNGKNQV